MIAGLPVVRLEAADPPPGQAGLVSAEVIPGRGMMLLQARARLADGRELDLLEAPDPREAARRLDGGPDDFAGNRAFSFGGALLVPYANRIRGRAVEGAREIETEVAGRTVRLPANWSGKAPGSEPYAMHGLLLDKAFPDWTQPDPTQVTARFAAGDFGGRWLSASEVSVTWRLQGRALELDVQVANAGGEPLPVGIGWHPWFVVPSGRRDQVRLHVPAAARLEVDNYDSVLPTGRVLPLAGTEHDVSGAGRPLGDLYLDDCFVQLARDGDGALALGFDDPAAGLGVRLTTRSPAVKAVQVYAPPDRQVVVLEPQFNWADPYGAEWSGQDTGMVLLAPGQSTEYRVRLEVVAA